MDAEFALLYGIVLMSWLEYGWNLYLILRQRNVLKSSNKIPQELSNILTEETFTKARGYNLDNVTFSVFHSLFDNIVGTLMIVLFLMPYLWRVSTSVSQKFGFTDSELVISVIFMLLMNTINSIISIPFQIYHIFVIEEKHGFNKQTAGFFIKDTLKSYVIIQILIAVVTIPVIYIIKAGGKYFFLYLWLFALVFTLFFMTIYPEVIAPLFDKYTPLPDGELRNKIEELASSINFPLTKIYVVEGSKRSAHSNAYLYGFFNNKRIVLFDTLLKSPPASKKTNGDEKDAADANKTMLDDQSGNSEEDDTSTKPIISPDTEDIPTIPSKNQSDDTNGANSTKGCTDDEILAVLAHELGHWKKSHVLKQLFLSEANLFLLFMAFSLLYQYGIIYRAFGFYDTQPVLVGLLIILQFIFTPYHFLLQLLVTVITRKLEFEADDFAATMGKGEFLKKALIKLNQDNLGFPIYDWLYSMFNHSHPPLLERIRAIDEKKHN